MPLEVVDLRSEDELPVVLDRHGGWDRPELAKAQRSVRQILDDVRDRGDEGVIAQTKRFDGAELTPARLRVSVEERNAALEAVSPKVVEAMRAAARNIRRYHEAQLPADWTIDRDGATVGQVFRPIRRVGLYAPGGLGAYPSTVLMTAIPAQVAGVPEIVLCTPPDPLGRASEVILAAAHVAGIEEIYRVGGAQAIAALGYGTETIRGVDKVCGPGNVYVTLAKRELYGRVGIDGLFGPSESMVVADDDARPAFSASELLKQAEHDPDATAVLVTTSEDFLGACLREVEARLAKLPRAKAIRDAFAAHGLAILVRDLGQAAAVVDRIAPEHLCIHVADADGFLETVHASGVALLGEDTPAALSDYCAGPSHVLPTARTARFASGLSVREFLVGINTIRYSRQALFRDAPIADALGEAEDLQAHREGVHVRLEALEDD